MNQILVRRIHNKNIIVLGTDKMNNNKELVLDCIKIFLSIVRI